MSTAGDSDTIAPRHHRDRDPAVHQHQPAPAVRPGLPRHHLDRLGGAPRRRAARSASRRRSPPRAATPSRPPSPASAWSCPAGELKQRSNDTDYPFRAHSAFSHLTGWASDSEPGSVARLRAPHRRRSRRHPVLPRARRPHDERVLLGCLDRRVLDRPAARAGRRRRRPRPRDRAHRRLRGGRRRRAWSTRTTT